MISSLIKSRSLWLEFTNKNQEKETVVEQEILITLWFNLATGKALHRCEKHFINNWKMGN